MLHITAGIIQPDVARWKHSHRSEAPVRVRMGVAVGGGEGRVTGYGFRRPRGRGVALWLPGSQTSVCSPAHLEVIGLLQNERLNRGKSHATTMMYLFISDVKAIPNVSGVFYALTFISSPARAPNPAPLLLRIFLHPPFLSQYNGRSEVLTPVSMFGGQPEPTRRLSGLLVGLRAEMTCPALRKINLRLDRRSRSLRAEDFHKLQPGDFR